MRSGLAGLLPGRGKKAANKKAAGPKGKRAGPALAARLNELIDEQASEERDRDQIIDEMAEAAGIERATVLQILDGEIDCPPIDRLEAFAGVLDVAVDDLVAAGEQDGCSYGAADDGSGEGEGGEEAAKAAVTRIAAILRSPHAKGRGDLAMTLALDTSLSAPEALKVLRKTPAGAAKGRLSAEMAADPPPQLGAGDAPSTSSVTIDASSIYAERRKASKG